LSGPRHWKDFISQIFPSKFFQQKCGAFSAKWNYLPGSAGQYFPFARQILPVAFAARQTSPGPFFRGSANSMFKRI
jgi:hypothetical protein